MNLDIGRKVVICKKHPTYLVGLIVTHLFEGGTHYCPYCAAVVAKDDVGDEVLDEDGTIWARTRTYRAAIDRYFKAVDVCQSDRINYPEGSGSVINPHAPPPPSRDDAGKAYAEGLKRYLAEMERVAKAGWKKGQKAEDLPAWREINGEMAKNLAIEAAKK